MSIRFLHAADLHLDSPFQGLDDRRAALRREEQRDLLSQLVSLADQEQADIILLSGDLFDSNCTYQETTHSLEQAFSQCHAKVFIAPGNHDWYGLGSPWTSLVLPEQVHLFTHAAPEAVLLPELGLRIWGAAFQGPECGPMLQNFSVARQPGLREIMVLHGELNPHSRYGPLTEADIAGSGLDYLALGHIHSASGLRRAGDTYYAWPGCPEGRGFDECGEKGVYLGLLEDNGTVQLSFRPLGHRQYHRERLDITNVEDLPTALATLLAQGGAGDIWRISLLGERDAAPDPALLLHSLEEHCFALEIRDNTRPRRDLWEQAEADSLRGLFLRKMRTAFSQAEDEVSRAQVIQAVRWGLAALDGGEELRP